MKTNHVVSKGLVEEMKALGFPQVSEFWYCLERKTSDGKDILLISILEPVYEKEIEEYSYVKKAPAYNVSLVGEWLPNRIFYGKHKLWITRTEVGYWNVQYGGEGVKPFCEKIEKTMADSLAKMLIYLAKNKLLDPTTLKGTL